MYPIDVNEFIAQAGAVGFTTVYQSRISPDSLRRVDVRWIKLALQPVNQLDWQNHGLTSNGR